jgi:DNA-binding transcriptional ArsR family regulator
MRVITMNDYSALITELSNPTRIKLLLLLDDQKATSSELTKRVGGISSFIRTIST